MASWDMVDPAPKSSLGEGKLFGSGFEAEVCMENSLSSI